MPGLFELARRASAALGGLAFDLFYLEDEGMQAHAALASSPAIVLSKGLLNSLDDDEIVAVIGHEAGHIILNHLKYSQLAEKFAALYYRYAKDETSLRQLYFQIGGDVAFSREEHESLNTYDMRIPQAEKLVGDSIRWRQCREFSCDRCSAIAAGSVEPPINALFKQVSAGGASVQDRFGGRPTLAAFLEQQKDATSHVIDSSRKMDLVHSHPFLALRIRALQAFGCVLPAYLPL